jgi:hypothetical protein
VGDPFAIHGFCSDGRHDVNYWRFKDFGQPYDGVVEARAWRAWTGQLSTRMGAAIRHASGVAQKRNAAAKKLLLVITDGEPADVDVRDPQYLRQDTKKAVEEAGRSGVVTYCMSLDPRADQYVRRIFGAHATIMVVDKVERLPEKLPVLYAGSDAMNAGPAIIAHHELLRSSSRHADLRWSWTTKNTAWHDHDRAHHPGRLGVWSFAGGRRFCRQKRG